MTDEYVVDVPVNGELTVEFGGTAHDQNDRVYPSKLSFSAKDNWGMNGNGHEAKKMKLQRMGATNPGQTEYWVFFNVSEVK